MHVHNRVVGVIAALTVPILVVSAAALAKTVFVPVSGTALQVVPPERIQTNCIGGTPTASWPPCMPGSKSQIRGWNLAYRLDFRNPDGTPDTLLTGNRYQVSTGPWTRTETVVSGGLFALYW